MSSLIFFVADDNFLDSRSGEFSENIYDNDENREPVESNLKIDNNIEETNIEYIKLDLDQDIEQNKEILENHNTVISSLDLNILLYH